MLLPVPVNLPWGASAEANAKPPVPTMGTNGTPGESSGSFPAERTEPGEIEETPGRSFDSPQEAEEINPTSLESIDPVDDLGESFGSLSVGCEENQTQPSARNLKYRRHRRKPRVGASRPKPQK